MAMHLKAMATGNVTFSPAHAGECGGCSPPTTLTIPRPTNFSGVKTGSSRSHPQLMAPPHVMSTTSKPPAPLETINGGMRVNVGYFESTEMKVRGCELDRYGGVRSAAYLNYIQHGNFEFMERVGLSGDEVARTGQALAMLNSSLKFYAPLRSGDRFVVSVKIPLLSAAKIYVENFIHKLPDYELIAESKATAVWLNKSYRPVRIPTDWRSKLTYFNSC